MVNLVAGGWADPVEGSAWRHDTLVDFYSVGKAFVALLALELVDAGLIALDDPVARVWPEFGAEGKEGATLRHALCHRAGVPALRVPLTNDDLWDWDRMTGALAATAPWWEPGTRHAYHTNTYGHLIGEVVRHVTGEGCGTRLAALAGPLDAHLYVGVPPAERHPLRRGALRRVWAARRAGRHPGGGRSHGDAELLQPVRLLVHGRGQHGSLARRRDPFDQRAWFGAGRGTPLRRVARPRPRALARPAGGGDLAPVRGVLPDSARGRHLRAGIEANGATTTLRPNPGSFGHFGTGGAVGFADPAGSVAFGYVMNHVIPRWQSTRNRALIDALYGSF